MRKLMLWSQSRPVVVLLILAVITVIASLRLPRLRVDASSRSMMVENDPALIYYEETMEMFPTDKLAIVYVRDQALFTPEKLQALDDLARDLEKIAGVDSIDSLLSVEDFRDEGGLYKGRLIDGVPTDQEGADKAKRDALRNPVLRKNLISDDATCTAINLKLNPYHLREARPGGGGPAPGSGEPTDLLDELDTAGGEPAPEAGGGAGAGKGTKDADALDLLESFDPSSESLDEGDAGEGKAAEGDTGTKAKGEDADALDLLESFDLDSGTLDEGDAGEPDDGEGSVGGEEAPVDREQYRERNFSVNVALRIEEVLKKHLANFGSVFQLGSPYAWKTITDSIMGDQMSLIPASVCVLLVMLVVTMRSSSGAILPMMTAGLSVFWTLGFMCYLGIPITMLSSIVPSLIIVIGATEDIHILCEYMEGMREEGIREKAIRFVANKVGTAVLLTALTTFLGFLSLATNKITIVQQFGMAAAFGMFVNPFITCMLAPVYLRYFGQKEAADEKESFVDHLLGPVSRLVVKVIRDHRRALLVAILGPTALLAICSTQLRVENDLLGYFRKGSEIRKRAQTLHEDLAGGQTFFVRIGSGVPGYFKEPQNLSQVDALQKRIEELGFFDKTISVADYIKLANRGMNGGAEEEFRVPDTRAMIANLAGQLKREEIETYVTPDFDEVTILVRHNISSSRRTSEVLRELEKEMKEILNPHLEFGMTGESLLINKGADSLVSGQVSGIALLLVVVFVLMSILFVNVKAGLLSLVPNLLPIILNFGIMVLLGIPLNIGSCMVAAMAIGIAVDDTIHLMTRYNREMRDLQDQQKAVEVCIHAELRPVLSTSISLAICFAVLSFSSFVPVAHFGLLSAMVMIHALLADLFVTPLLLSTTQLTTLLDMVALRLHDDVIRASKLFAGLKPWQIKKVILLGRLEEKAAGEYAVTQGDFGKSMYLILEGKAAVVSRDEAGRELVFATLGAGDVFGEVALVDPGPRTASVRAEEPIQFIEIDWDGLRRIQKVYARIASQLFLNLSRILGERLAATDKMLTHQSGGPRS